MKLNLFFSKKISFLKSWVKVFSNLKNIQQIINPKKIPFVILNFNQLFYLKKLVNFAIERGFENIIIIDNLSTYPPLLDYYKTIEKKVTIERMDKNYGYLVFFSNQWLIEKYGNNFFILTDADIEPNPNLPKNFMRRMIWILIKYSQNILKVGFALRIDDIPDTFAQRERAILWEKKFWENKIEDDLYLSPIDTTFALYKPNTKGFLTQFSNFYLAIRIAGNYTAKHGGWYMDYNNMTEEEQFYVNSVNKSSSWVMAEKDIENHNYL